MSTYHAARNVTVFYQYWNTKLKIMHDKVNPPHRNGSRDSGRPREPFERQRFGFRKRPADRKPGKKKKWLVFFLFGISRDHGNKLGPDSMTRRCEIDMRDEKRGEHDGHDIVKNGDNFQTADGRHQGTEKRRV